MTWDQFDKNLSENKPQTNLSTEEKKAIQTPKEDKHVMIFSLLIVKYILQREIAGWTPVAHCASQVHKLKFTKQSAEICQDVL